MARRGFRASHSRVTHGNSRLGSWEREALCCYSWADLVLFPPHLGLIYFHGPAFRRGEVGSRNKKTSHGVKAWAMERGMANGDSTGPLQRKR